MSGLAEKSDPQKINVASATAWGGYDSLEEHAHRFGFTVKIEGGKPILIPGPEMKFLYIASTGCATLNEAHQFLWGFGLGERFGKGIEGAPCPGRKLES